MLFVGSQKEAVFDHGKGAGLDLQRAYVRKVADPDHQRVYA